MKKILVTFGIVVVLASAGFFWLFMSANENMCGNEIFKEVNSPSLEFKAVIFQRDCGATTGFSTQVSVIPITETLPNEGGNVLIIDGHPGDTQLEISWLSNYELKISKNLNGTEYKAEKGIGLSRKILVSYGKS
jgi:hypothetical protein